MTLYQWLWFSLLYLLCGQVFSLVYLLTFERERSKAWLGLMGLFFPVYLIIDLILTFASGLGAYSKTILSKFDRHRAQ
jgi:hypothetical protein